MTFPRQIKGNLLSRMNVKNERAHGCRKWSSGSSSDLTTFCHVQLNQYCLALTWRIAKKYKIISLTSCQPWEQACVCKDVHFNWETETPSHIVWTKLLKVAILICYPYQIWRKCWIQTIDILKYLLNPPTNGRLTTMSYKSVYFLRFISSLLESMLN